MAEKVVSPVYLPTRKIYHFFLLVAQIGAAMVSIYNERMPAFVLTCSESFNDFKEKFGGLHPDFYAPYAVQQYMKNWAGRVTVVRVLHLGGYSVDQPLFIYVASGSASGSGDTDTKIRI